MRRGVIVGVVVIIAVTACSSSTAPTAHLAPRSPRSTASPTTLAPSTTATTLVPAVSISPPTQFSAPNATWVRVRRADGKTQLAVVFRPRSGGRHPAVVVIHGSSGLSRLQVAWSARLAAKGFVVVTGCYLDAASPGFLPCPGLPNGNRVPASNVRSASSGYRALLEYARGLPGTTPGVLGVIGLSLGAIVALSDDARGVDAIVADSGYRDVLGITRGPVLLLGFTNDPNVSHTKVVAFEQAQRAHNPVDVHYYAGNSHVTMLTPSTTDDATARIVAFLRAHLANTSR